MNTLQKLRREGRVTQLQAARGAAMSRMRLSLYECGQAELTAEEEKALRNSIRAAIAQRASRLQDLLSSSK